MSSIINTQLFRLKKSKLFWILLGVCFMLPLLGVGLEYVLVSIMGGLEGASNTQIWDTLRQMGVTYISLSALANIGSDGAFLSLICSAVILSKEFTNGTVRNAILANKSRKQLYFGYLTIAMIIGVSYLLANIVGILLFYGIVFGFEPLKFGPALTSILCSLTLGLLAIALVQTCVCMFLFATRKQSSAIIFPILICLVAPGVIAGIAEVIFAVMESAGVGVSVDAMGWVPLYNMALYDASAVQGGIVGQIALYDVLLVALFGFLGYRAFVNAELK